MRVAEVWRTGRHAFGDYCREGGRNDEAQKLMGGILTAWRKNAASCKWLRKPRDLEERVLYRNAATLMRLA
jgi:hypothetical protein